MDASGRRPRLRARHGQNERAIALGRKAYLFAAAERGGKAAATLYSLLGTCKLHGVEPYAYLKDVLERLAQHPVNRLAELLPFNWQPAGR